MLDWIVDDAGRAGSATPNARGDCLTRAIAVITGIPYDEVAGFVAAICAEHGMAETHDFEAGAGFEAMGLPPGCDNIGHHVLECFGFKRWTPSADGAPVSKAHQAFGKCVIEFYGHVAAAQGGAIHDTWDSRQCQWREGCEARALAVWCLD